MLSSRGLKYNSDLYFKLTEYRWWVGLWSNSNGYLSIEIPNELSDYFDSIQKNGDKIYIYDKEKNSGIFSTLSQSLMLNIDFFGNFEGQCEIIK